VANDHKTLIVSLSAALLIAGLSSAASADSAQTREAHPGSESGPTAVEEAVEDMPRLSRPMTPLEMAPADEGPSKLRGSIHGVEVPASENTGSASELRGSIDEWLEMRPADINTEIQSELRGPVDDVEMPSDETIPAEGGVIESPEN
jgi:hypothetical protein